MRLNFSKIIVFFGRREYIICINMNEWYKKSSRNNLYIIHEYKYNTWTRDVHSNKQNGWAVLTIAWPRGPPRERKPDRWRPLQTATGTRGCVWGWWRDGHAGDGLRLLSRGTRYRSDRDDVRARRRESLQGIAIGECFALLWRHAPPFHRTQTTAAPMVRVVEGLKFNLGLSNGRTIKIILS